MHTNILIFTKKDNIKEIYDYIRSKFRLTEGSRICKDEGYVISDDFEIRIKKYNESVRYYRSRIILYDGDFTKEELDGLQVKLVDGRHIPLNTEPLNETLLAPIGVLQWLLRSDITYIVANGYSNKTWFIGNDLIKSLTKMDDGEFHDIYFYETNSDKELWWSDNRCDDKLIRSSKMLEVFDELPTN